MARKKTNKTQTKATKTEPVVESPPVEEEPVEEEKISPAEYFKYVKEKKSEVTEEYLKSCYAAIEKIAARLSITGQEKALKKLKFLEECLDLEMPIVKAGYRHYVNRWDIEEYIDKIADPCVFIKEMKNYEREFPDEVIEEIIKAKEVFGDSLYVLFTDYTKKEARKVAKERREKDPILFGAITKKGSMRNSSNVVLDRLYYICDWVDEYCDLTLDKLVDHYAKEGLKSPVHTVVNGEDPDSIQDAMGSYIDSVDYGFVDSASVKDKDMLILNSYVNNSMTTIVKDIDLEESITKAAEEDE